MMPPLFFVHVQESGEIEYFLTEKEAQEYYDARIAAIKKEVVACGEFDGSEKVTMGRVLKRAEVAPVAIDTDTEEEIFDLVSFNYDVPEASS